MASSHTWVEPRVTAYEATLESDAEPSSRELAQYFHYALSMNREVAKAEYAARKC